MRRVKLLAAGVATLVLGGVGAARAADLVVDCKVHASQPDHGKTDWRRRLIINHETRTVRVLDDFGGGLEPRAKYPLVGANALRITLEDHAGKTAYIDRQTHIYHLKDEPMKFTLEGPCARVKDAR
jgi:hypothetical protein